MKKKKPSKPPKTSVCFTEDLLNKLDELTESHFKPKLGMDRSQLICYLCQLGLRYKLPETIADMGSVEDKEVA